MVEMMEANAALCYATKHSLILFDEIGRGTATYDGMALAQAMLEYIDEAIGAKTLFSTHYHELTDLEKEHPSMHNVHVDVREEKMKLNLDTVLLTEKQISRMVSMLRVLRIYQKLFWTERHNF